MTRAPTSRASEWKRGDICRKIEISVRGDTTKSVYERTVFKETRKDSSNEALPFYYFRSINGTQNSDWQSCHQTFLRHLAKEIVRLCIGLGELAICHTQEGSQFTGQRLLNAKGPQEAGTRRKNR